MTSCCDSSSPYEMSDVDVPDVLVARMWVVDRCSVVHLLVNLIEASSGNASMCCRKEEVLVKRVEEQDEHKAVGMVELASAMLACGMQRVERSMSDLSVMVAHVVEGWQKRNRNRIHRRMF